MAGIKINILSNFNSSGFDKLTRELRRLDTPIEKLGAVSRSLAPAAQIGLIAMTGLGTAAIRAAEDAQVADRRLANVAESMNLFGKETASVVKRLGEFADATMKKTAVDDELIKSTQAQLLTFKSLAQTANTTGGAFDRATLAALDMAAVFGGDGAGNAIKLGKALNDPIKGISALTRVGIQFTQEQKNMIKALVETSDASASVAVGLFESEREYNDFIKAQVKAGATAKETARFFKDNLTAEQYNLFNQLRSTSDMLGAQEIILKEIETQVGGTAAATASASAKMTVAFGEMSESIGNALLPLFEQLVPIVTGFFNWLGKNSSVVTILAGAFTALSVAILAVNFALNANPIVKVITLIGALATGVLLLVDYLVRLYGGWDKLFKDLGKWLGSIGEAFRTTWDGITNFFTGVVEGYITIWARFFNNIINGLNGIISLANTALAAVAAATGGAVNIKIPNIPTVKVPKNTKIPKLAEGGIVMPRPGGVLANLAEAGQPEAVIPLDRLNATSKPSVVNNYNITVSGGVGSGATIGKAVVDAIKAYERTSGAVFAGA